jgi:predicted GNAT family N-acyltransferase
MNASSHTIRAYTPADERHCLNSFKSNIPGFFGQHEVAEFEEWLDELEKESADNNTSAKIHYYVISNNEKIVGCGGFALKENNSEVVLAWGLIDRQFHKQGYGQALLEYRLTEIRFVYPGMDILLDTSQHSCGFFQKYGFKVEKITPGFYAPGLDRYDMRFVP